MELLKLLGIVIVIAGFALKLDSILVILVAAVVTALVGGLGPVTLLETLGVVTVFSSALDGVIIAFVAYWILYSLLKNTKLAGSGDMTIEEACSVAQ